MVRDYNSDEQFIIDYEKRDDGYYNDVMINNFEDENFNDDVIEEVNGEGEDEVNKLQFILDKNLKFANKIKSLNEMKFDNLQVLIDAKIIENGKNELKASNANDSLCGIDMINPDTKITVGSFAESMLEFVCSTNLGEENVTKLLKIIKDYFPFSHIPLKQTNFGN